MDVGSLKILLFCDIKMHVESAIKPDGIIWVIKKLFEKCNI